MNIDNCTARKEYLSMPEEAQRKFERFEKWEKAFGEKEVKADSLMQNFTEGMISGAIAAPLMAIGPLATIAGPSIMSAVGGRIRNVQVLNGDEATKLLTKSKHNKRSPGDIMNEPGMTTYIFGLGIAALGAALSGTPLGPILIGIGAGMVGTGISTVGETGAEQARNRNYRR
ncbi:hypothetical protein [Candidatus Rhabdochlamydia sp. T3358]|uniref:hypothetical protein n=1 Tax=Candidatus Rhabdochlamydia sp. T3358 TaxID=2099795 RepID=UPI0010BAD4AF|nr:hypothetical protein [Candidatus Rhabdochlamydia sp. T3358]VHN99508.1 hypothetical protein RHT_00025 [Candidatus Rhabdochlamydia sp. T3358]